MIHTNGSHPEMNGVSPYSSPSISGEEEWETPAQFSQEEEWETPAQFSQEEETAAQTTFEGEADPFFPLLALAAKPLIGLAVKKLGGMAAKKLGGMAFKKLGGKLLPRLANRAISTVRRQLIPRAVQNANQLARRILGSAGSRPPQPIRVVRASVARGPYGHPTQVVYRPARRQPPPGSPGYRQPTYRQPPPGSPSYRQPMYRQGGAGIVAGSPSPSSPWSAGPIAGRPGVPQRRATVAGLLRQLADVFGEGELETAELEAHLFGASSAEGELANHEVAHELALTEVLAAEATHAPLAEAEALLGAALPVTVRVLGSRRLLRPVMPTLVRANSQLIAGIHRLGPAERELLRLVPAVQRRTIASLRIIRRSGRQLTPDLVAQVMAGHVARVFGTPQIAGPALVRNLTIRQGTVAPARF